MKSKDDYSDELRKTIKSLMETTWGNVVNLVDINKWLSQFGSNGDPEMDEQLHAMYLLSHFLYFDQASLRELLRSVYRDLFRTPLLHQIRKNHGDTLDSAIIEPAFKQIRDRTRFLGVGNPSESGVHLLYYFRQENGLPKNLFINSYEIFKREVNGGISHNVVRDPDIEYYVYLDDLCGSGSQAREYSQDLVMPLKAVKSDAKVFYFVLFATSQGLQAVRDLGCFDRVSAVFELDSSFQCLEPGARIFEPEVSPYLRANIKLTCEKFGRQLWPTHPLGYKNGQLLIGFNHNTPDNTLPIFWCNEHVHWRPIFKRYHKDYGP
jgi:hypothetical protein